MTGTLFSVGVGPGDPELMTLKAARILASVPIIAYFAKHGRPGHARTTVAAHLPPGIAELRFEYPYTTELSHMAPDYKCAMTACYQSAANAIASHLSEGRDVALLCEGDPFFYGSAMYVFDIVGRCFPHQAIPGITGMSGCWSRAGMPMTHGDDVLTVLPATLDARTLAGRLAGTDAAVIMKLGRNLPKVRTALQAAGRTGAVYVERGTMAGERIIPVEELDDAPAPYFAIVLVPGRNGSR